MKTLAIFLAAILFTCHSQAEWRVELRERAFRHTGEWKNPDPFRGQNHVYSLQYTGSKYVRHMFSGKYTHAAHALRSRGSIPVVKDPTCGRNGPNPKEPVCK